MRILNKIFSSKKIVFLFAFAVLALFSVKTVFAVWNGTFYEPGTTLNPECLPTQTNCDVRPPLTSVNISDTIYGASWDADTTHAPSKNAIYDKIETLATVSHNAVTLGTANGLSLATQVLSLALASTSTAGALSSTDWNTFSGKQDALVSGTNIKTINSNSLLGAGNISVVTTDQTSSQTIGTTGARLAKLWATNLDVTNTIVGSISGNAGTVTTNANLTGVITSIGNATSIASQTGTGTKFVVDTSPTIITPTITTSATIPLVIGGTLTTSPLTLRSTSGIGAAGADIIFQVGNNGATEAMRILNNGNVGIGTTTPSGLLQVAQLTTGVGTVSNLAGGTTVTGVGTQFTNTFKVGDTITIPASTGQTVAISAIVSDTSMTTTAITAANSGVAYSLVGGNRFAVLGNGNVGIGTTSPGTALAIGGTGQITVPDGTVSAPSYSFTSSTGTGLYWDSTNGTALRLSLGGAQLGLLQFHPTVGTSAVGQGNTFLGYKAGLVNYTSASNAYNNTFVGGQSGQANDAGYQNTFLGSSSGALNTSGFTNTFLGQGAGYSNTTASGSVAVGWHAGLNVIGSAGFTENTLIGAQVAQGVAGSTANANVFVGSTIGIAVTSATENAIIGRQAAYALTSGGQNAILGSAAGISLSTGSDNIFIGRRSGYTQTAGNATTTGSQNIFIGTEAGASTSSQLSNAIAIGYRALVGTSNTMVLGNSSITTTLMNGNVGIGTISPTNLLSLDGTTARTIWMERNTTAATAGQGLTLSSGGAIAGTADLAGGDLTLKSGISTGTGTSSIHFYTATAGLTGTLDNAPTEKMTILGSGKVGIGIASPLATLDIAGTSPSTFLTIPGLAHGITDKVATNVAIAYETYDTNGGLYALGIRKTIDVPSLFFDGVLANTVGSTTVPVVGFYASKKAAVGTGVQAVADTDMAYAFYNLSSTNPILTMKGSGLVGVGKIPTAQLDIQGKTDANIVLLKLNSQGAMYQNLMELGKDGVVYFNVSGTGGTYSTNYNPFNAAQPMYFYGGSSLTARSHIIAQMYDFETISSGFSNTFKIQSYLNSSGTAAHTALLISRYETAYGSGAQLLIDAQAGATGTTSKFSVTNAGVIRQTGCTTAGTLSANVSGDIICTPSSQRFKNGIVDLNKGLSDLLALRPVAYTFNPDMNLGSGIHFGFISEEVAAVAPEFATHDKNGMPYGLDTNAILAATVNAIKELNLNLEGVAGTVTPLPGSPSESFITAFFANIKTTLSAWLADAGNGIGNIFAKEVNTNTLCVADSAGAKTCLTKAQLDALLSGAGTGGGTGSGGGPGSSGGIICAPPQVLINNVCADPTPGPAPIEPAPLPGKIIKPMILEQGATIPPTTEPVSTDSAPTPTTEPTPTP